MNAEQIQSTPDPQLEPLTFSLLGRFFGVPLLIIAVIVSGAITVVLLFGAPASPAPRSLETLLQAVESEAGIKNMGMLLPPDKEYWQTNLELAERIDKQEFTATEMDAIAERLSAVVILELDRMKQAAAESANGPYSSGARHAKQEFLIRALGKTQRAKAVETLLEVLASQNFSFVNVAIQQLGDMHQIPEARAASASLLPFLKATFPSETRMMAVAALSVLADPGDQVILAALNDLRLAEEGEVAWNAALALARLGSIGGKSTLLDMLDRSFWEQGERYQVTDEKNQVRRFVMPPQRVDDMLIATMDAVARVNDPELWALIDGLRSDKSLSVKAKAVELTNRRAKMTASAPTVSG